MENKEFKWLPHLENSIPAGLNGYMISFYSVALEGWRRGLQLKFINRNRSKVLTAYELSSKERKHEFTDARGDLVPKEAVRTCIDKFETKKQLEKASVPTPKGEVFKVNNSDQELLSYANSLGYPLVLKPTDGHGGKGVIAGIKNEEEMKNAIGYVRGELGYSKVIIEEHFTGDDYRVYVVGNEAVAVTKRVQANIKGDGISTIRKLINQNNKLRKISPILGASLIKVDKELKDMVHRKNYTLQSVPSQDEIVYLKSINNISAGGDPCDITDDVPNEIKKLAVGATKSIPGLIQAGVDLMVDNKNNKAVVIEVNSRGNLRSHLFPMIGEARDIPSKIIDYYFPETKGKSYSKKFYFEFEPIWQSFKYNHIKEAVIPKMPIGKDIEIKRFRIDGNVQDGDYGEWLGKNIRFFNLHGSFKFLNAGRMELIIGGKHKNISELIDFIKEFKPRNTIINNISIKDYNKEINIGFKNYNLDMKQVKRFKKSSKLKELKTENEVLKKERKTYKMQYEDIKKSNSWRITKPLRVVGKITKGK